MEFRFRWGLNWLSEKSKERTSVISSDPKSVCLRQWCTRSFWSGKTKRDEQMPSLKDLGCSIGGAIVISSFSIIFYPHGGDLLAIPGILIEGWVNLLIILVSDDPYTRLDGAWVVFNVLFFSVVIFCCLFVVKRIRFRS